MYRLVYNIKQGRSNTPQYEAVHGEKKGQSNQMNDYEHYEYIKRMVKRDQMISHVLTAVTLVVMGLGALACAWIIDRII